MRRRDIFWVAVLLVTGWAYLHYFRNAGGPKEIGIVPSLRTTRRQKGLTVYPVYFVLDHACKLTGVKVTEVETNTAAPKGHVLWHLVSSAGSGAIKFFVYGESIPGMDPYLKGVPTEPLQTNVTYRLELAAGKITGAVNFHTQPVPQ